MKNVILPLGESPSLIEKIGRQRLFTPINIIIVGYLIVIFIGALSLMLPWSTYSRNLSFTDALFTATSATTVTGLVVKETGTYFTFFGQFIIWCLIQIGGLGYMTLFGFFLLSGYRRISFEQRMLLRETLNSPTVKGIRKMAKRIFFFIVSIEIFGALVLTLRWLPEYGLKSVWYGLFHSIAAFNNAGFDIIGSGNLPSLTKYSTDIVITLTMALLIISGGIGFYVLSDIYRVVRKRKERLSYQTAVVCITTVILLSVGTLFFLTSEYNNPNTVGKYSFGQKVLISFFSSVTPRTAGFSTVVASNFLPLTIVLMIILMFIGASPGGTGGGVKTTTLAILWAYIKSCITGKENVNLLYHKIVRDRVNKAFIITFFSITVIAVVSFLLVAIDNRSLVQAAFETTSAFSTVGLTMGITPTLSIIAKYLIISTMFCGKVGVLTSILFFMGRKRGSEVVLPTGELTM